MAGDMFPQTKENMGLRRPRDMENLENIDWLACTGKPTLADRPGSARY